MSIESPDKCGNVWFAFSQYPWEQETLDRYRSDTKARSERMQKVMPSVSGSQRTKTDEFKNNRFSLMGVMGLKTVVDGLAVTKSVGLLLEQFSKPIAKKVAGKITGFLAWEFLGIRILAVLITWEAMVAIILLQAVVTWMSDDELQIWCEKCVFGTEPFNRSLTDQNKALEAAIKDIS